MSVKTLSWIVFGLITLGLIWLFNYWAAYQLLSTLLYAGIIAAFVGLANLIVPFRFLGIRKRLVGAAILAGGIGLAFAGLLWPASTIHAAQHRTQLDDVLPEYQFWEKHSIRIHAATPRILQAVRESTFADMKSLGPLLRVRAAALHSPSENPGAFLRDLRILDSFAASGYAAGGSDHEIVMAGGANIKLGRPLQMHTLQEFANYRQPGGIKIAYGFEVEDAGNGWSQLTTETRMAAVDGAGRGMARYWRLIVPGSGLLRRQWLDGIKRRAENDH